MEMDTVIQGVPLLAVAVKYNSTKICFFILPEGAAPTLEMKWVVKGEESGKFRMATTIFGQGLIDTMQTLRGQSHPGHPIRSVTTKDFAESLASEMVDNELDGMVPRPKENMRKRATPLLNDTDSHVLSKIGMYPDTKTPVQLHCAMRHKKTTIYCTAARCGRVTICQSGKRTCHIDHCNGVARKYSKK